MSKITIKEQYGYYGGGEYSIRELESALDTYCDEDDHIVYRCRNNYGVSVIREQNTWNVAVIKYHGRKATDYYATFDTPITDFVIHTDSKSEIVDTILQIRDLGDTQKKLGLEVIDYFKSIPIPDRKVYY